MKIQSTQPTSHTAQPEGTKHVLDMVRAKHQRAAEGGGVPGNVHPTYPAHPAEQTTHESAQGGSATAQQGGQASSNAALPAPHAWPHHAAPSAAEGAEGAALEAASQGVQLKYDLDEDTGQMQVAVHERASGKLVRKIPSDELLKLAERMREMNVKAREELVQPSSPQETTAAAPNKYGAGAEVDDTPPTLDTSL